ncbi:MAG: hypothetical protein HYY06_15395 [Deltaproteobacteria bacterium]|nr:hypothetical protein [Deltaproteobacteria bacterium]
MTRTIWIGDTETRERVDLWSDDDRIPLTEAWLDCRERQDSRDGIPSRWIGDCSGSMP